MSHNKKIIDKDPCFEIDAITRAIRNVSSTKTTLMQYDHNSERFTFTLPRFVEGHDMMESTNAEVHYMNAGSPGLYEITDLSIDETDENKIKCTWLISQNATLKVGALQFLLRFACVAEDGTLEYSWHTGIHNGITVSAGMNNAEAIIEIYADVLEQLKAELLSQPKSELGFSNGIKFAVNENILQVVAKGDEGETVTRTFVDETGDTLANYAEEADIANYAYEADLSYFASDAENDADGRPLKGTINSDLGDVDNAEMHLDDGCAFYYGIISESLIVYLPEDTGFGHNTALYFTTPSVIPENYTWFDADVCFKGDSTDNGAFVPEPNMRYTIVFDFDGYMLNGYVSGVTTV